jgi:tRNA U34 5-methylaminomethyl-2-thiouridine-forming methyltransferase MnmC
MQNPQLKIVRTSDGSDTLFVPALNEHYHSVFGAVQESEYIFTGCGFDFCRKDPVRILEAGFGTGLNVFLTYIRNTAGKRNVKYVSVELYPLPANITGSLNYPDTVPGGHREIFKKIHSCPWDEPVDLEQGFTLHKIKGDLLSLSLKGEFDLIYFDAFGPDKQPEMWSDDVFGKLSDVAAEGCVLVTYSAKGEVRRTLNRHGFEVTLLPGPPGKRQIIRAVKK